MHLRSTPPPVFVADSGRRDPDLRREPERDPRPRSQETSPLVIAFLGPSLPAELVKKRSGLLAGVRPTIDAVLDHVRFRIDTFHHGNYHPVASLPGRSAARGTGSESRWAAMLPVIRERAVESAVDIGASEGYFSIMLGEAGIPAIAMEGDPVTSRTAIFAVRRSGLDNVGVLVLELTPDNVVVVPASDCILCLSIWHHFVRYYGLGPATSMLESIWSRTGKVLFFDTGENEMTPEYRLPPMDPDPRSWLSAYLAETCSGSRIEHLGMHAAFDPSGRPCERNLFAVIQA